MKKYITLLLLITSCSHFQTKQQRAESLVKLYLDSTLNDPKSYESIKFSKLDTIYTTFQDDPIYKQADEKADSIENAFNVWKEANPEFDGVGDLSHNQALYYEKMNDFYSDQKIVQLKIKANIAQTYVSKFKGWQINNEYRAKNGFGALGIHGTKFILDSSLTMVMGSNELTN